MPSIRTYRATAIPVAPIPIPKGVPGVVAYGRGDYIGEVLGPYNELSSVAADLDNLSGGSPNDLDEDGHSAAYRWCRECMSNGGRKIYVIEPAVSATQTITMTGNGTQRIFDLIVDKTGGAGALTISPIPGTVNVEHPLLTVLVENVDYIVDWSQGIIEFKTAPAAAADNIQVKWQEYTSANVQAAFVNLENVPIDLVGGAYFMNDNTDQLYDDLKAHTDNAESVFRQRVGFATGFYKDTAALIATAAANISEDMSFWANRSGYFNDNIVDPATTWMEYIDPTGCIMGVTVSLDPWRSLHEKPMANLNQQSDWNSTQIAALVAAYVNRFEFDGISGYNAKDGWNNEGATAYWRYVDTRRTWIYVKNYVESNLRSKKIIGDVQVTRDGISLLERTIYNSLVNLYGQGAIGNPEFLYLSWPGYEPVAGPLISAFRINASQRSAAQNTLIQNTQSLRETDVTVYYDYQGSLHYVNLYLGGL